MSSTNKIGVCRGAMPPGPRLGFSLFDGMEDESCNVIFGIPKEKGIDTEGMD
jgi:hypothetical protein